MNTTELENEHLEDKNIQSSITPQILKDDSGTQELPVEQWAQEACTLENHNCGVHKSAAVRWEDSVFAAAPMVGYACTLWWLTGTPTEILVCQPLLLLPDFLEFYFFMIWFTIWSISSPGHSPDENLFGLFIVFYCYLIGGKLWEVIRIPSVPPLPPLFGILLAGFTIRNAPYISEHVHIGNKWSSTSRNTALTLILIKPGLGLDPQALKRLKRVCLRLSMGPCLMEACSTAVISLFLMNFPWEQGFLLGFVVGAVPPAAVVPSMLHLQGEGYGTEKGIPTLLIAASSLDDIMAITGFSTFMSIVFSTGGILHNLLTSFQNVIIGVLLGTFLGIFLRYFQSEDQTNLPMKKACLILRKIFMALSWISKAIVQAVLGPLALETARISSPHLEPYSKDMMTIAFLAILITAPNGALLINTLGPVLLHTSPRDPQSQRNSSDIITDPPIAPSRAAFMSSTPYPLSACAPAHSGQRTLGSHAPGSRAACGVLPPAELRNAVR
ncbi:hypothetical protein QTO34_002226 [Cnephaeus nilssonii]|uniref:Cation/H+ exchanger transmembrane domain-containing protein n=1 Tax=Cnephaeus nilssonii TaxID=3371016 RepID=A0AA40HUA8_CNENI|nr:hypothetical protein QTO34_002226 [Eptesicus nilssonii]